MKTIQFPVRIRRDIAESRNFQQALERLKYGKSATPRSWVYENKDPKWILDTWSSELHKLDEDKDLNQIAEWDLSKADKFKSQGEVAPFIERQHTLKEYWAHLDSSPVFNDPLWKKAKEMAIKELGFNKFGKPSTVDEVINRGIQEDKYNTSSGDPLFIKRKKPEAIAQAKQAVENGCWDNYYPTLGSRASMGKTGTEARWIFMFPMSVNLNEQRFQQPLQDYIRSKKIPFFAPWEGYETVQQYLSTFGPQELVKFGCDYTKMDQHFNFHHAKECYDVIKNFFHPSYHAELLKSIEYTFNCSVIGPDGLILGPHAMPSGSGWTNFLETIFNFILKWYLKIKYHIDIVCAMGIGDDQLYFIRFIKKLKSFSGLTKLIVSVFNALGLEANESKQEVSYEKASFLQRNSYSFWHPTNIQYAGVYPTIRALTSLVFPEFYHNEKEWTKKTFALRCLMILENCRFHPLFKEFCIFTAKGNKNIIEFAKLPDAEILLTRHTAKKIANFIPTYNQEKRDTNPVKFDSLRVIREYVLSLGNRKSSGG